MSLGQIIEEQAFITFMSFGQIIEESTNNHQLAIEHYNLSFSVITSVLKDVSLVLCQNFNLLIPKKMKNERFIFDVY